MAMKGVGRTVQGAAVAGSCAFLAACIAEGTVLLSGIEVKGEIDEDSLQIEVHAFDAGSGAFLGCAGTDSGLEKVDRSGQRYDLKARFERSPELAEESFEPSRWMMDVDLDLRELVFVVTEDDGEPCPSVYGIGDDILGVSPVVAGETLSSSVKLAFDRVPYLLLEVR